MDRVRSEELCRNPHRLSLCGNVITFNNKRALATNGGERCELTFHRLSFKREDAAFLTAADGAAVVGRKTTARVGIVTCRCAVDDQKRVKTPFVLVARVSERGEVCQYTLYRLSGSDRLEPCIHFKLPYQITGDVSILQGPAVLWTHAGNVFYIFSSTQSGEVRQIPLKLSHTVVGELPLHRGQAFVLGVQNEDNQSTSQTRGYFVHSGHAFDGSMILPQPYVCITKCILVLSADTADGVLTADVVAVTSAQQLVYFQNGIVKDMCPLPFQHPEDIQLVNTGGYGCLFAISFHQGHVCAVWKDTFQIASQWSGISSILVDDFLGCGTDQILLVFEDEGAAGQPIEKFLITDLCGISYSHDADTGAPPAPPPASNLLTLQALESRLQSGMTMLQELQEEARVKDRVLQQSVQALTDVVSQREPVLTLPEQEGLIALWDSDDESKDEALNDKTQDMPAAAPQPRIDKMWHRIVGDRIVVGVILRTDLSVPVASVNLSILTETDQGSTPAVIQTQSQVLWLPTPCPSSSSTSASTLLEPAAKRSKQHDASTPNELNTFRMAVTAATRLAPLLNSGCVKCCVMLHYVQQQEAVSPVSNPTPVVLQCGQIALDIHSDFQTQLLKTPTLKTDEVKEDLLSLLTTLDRWVFRIDSPDHSLGDIDGWIQKGLGCKRIDVSPQYLLLNSAGPSALMLLRWHQITPFQGELSVHSSQLQMLQFLDSLLTHLPVSSSVHPVRRTTEPGAARIFSMALEKEVVSLRECVSLLLSGIEDLEQKAPGLKETPEPSSAEGLQRCRDAWQQAVRQSRMRLSPLVDVGQYRKLTQSMFKVQLSGDLAALLEMQRTVLH